MEIKKEKRLIDELEANTKIPSSKELHQAIHHYLTECYTVYGVYEDEETIMEVKGKFGISQHSDQIFLLFPYDRTADYTQNWIEEHNKMEIYGIGEDIEQILEANRLFEPETLENINEYDLNEVLVFYFAKNFAEGYILHLQENEYLTIVKEREIFDWENYF